MARRSRSARFDRAICCLSAGWKQPSRIRMLEPAMLKKLSGKGGLEGLRPSKSLILVVVPAATPQVLPPNKNVCGGRAGPPHPQQELFRQLLKSIAYILSKKKPLDNRKLA